MNPSMPQFHQIRDSTMLSTFPQPTRPTNSYNLDSPIQTLPLTSCPYEVDSIDFQPLRPKDNQYFYPNQERPAETTTTTKLDEENETAEELVHKIMELYQKLPENVRSQVKFNINAPSEMMRDLKVAASSSSKSIEGSPFQELSHRLGRFKIRTVQVGGIITAEETNQDVK